MKFEDAKKEALEFFKGDKLATDVFLKKYALTNKNGTDFLESTPVHMWKRMAKAGASIEKDKERWEREFFNIFQDFKAVPGGSIMFALGNSYQKSSCSNCFVFDVKDSLDGEGSIFRTAEEMARTYSYRGGCGLDISPLRPSSALVDNAAKTSSGAASFMDYYSYITRLIGINGRRGALMITMSVDHPDIELFTTMKHDSTKVTGANVSIRITDEFMKAVEKDQEWEATFKTNHETVSKKWRARALWKIIVDSATNTAEPGILFWDNIIKNSPADCYADAGFKTISTNPCSELPLAAYDACTLLSMNLQRYVRNHFKDDAYFDEKQFFKDVSVATRFLDNVKSIDSKLLPLEKQREKALAGRRIGMGMHGLADALAYLKIKYDSEQGVKWIGTLFEKYTKAVYAASVELAKEKGAFPVFNAKKEKGHPFLERIGFAGIPRRNIACMTVAPTGSVSIISQTSTGIEPHFRFTYTRKRKINHNEAVTDGMRTETNKVGEVFQLYQVDEAIATYYKSLTKHADLPGWFVSSDQIDWKKRVEIQGAITKWLDHSCSSTVNLPRGTSSDVVGKIYMEAWKSGCKGITVYVEGCRDGILVSEEETARKGSPSSNEPKRGDIIVRPEKVPCDIYRITADGDHWIVAVGLVENKPYEIFCGKQKKVLIEALGSKINEGYIEKVKRGQYSLHVGGFVLNDISDLFTDTQGALTRMISTSLRHGVDIKFIVQQLEKSDGELYSFNKAISRVLKKYIAEGEKENGSTCPQCGGTDIRRQGGCPTCSDCGYSKCS
jgi:ribonucleoside-diphosphate reductase alpha chain